MHVSPRKLLSFLLSTAFVSATLSTSALGQSDDGDEDAKILFRSPHYFEATESLDIGQFETSVLSSPLPNHLSALAYHCREDIMIQARLMALAFAISSDENRPLVIEVDFYIRHGKPLSRLARSIAMPRSGPDSLTPQNINAAIRARIVGDIQDSLQILRTGSSPKAQLIADLTNDVLATAHEKDLIEQTFTSSPSLDVTAFWALSDPAPIETTPVVESTSGNDMLAGKGDFLSRQSSLNGLVVISLQGSEYAGGASKMNATVFGEGDNRNPSTIRFNQTVGNKMQGSLNEVEKYLSIRHDGIPRGRQVELSFEERDSLKDGPSAAVACALLLDSVITGKTLDENFAVTGDMNADGAVQPVGGIDGKVRGAARNGCSHMALPADNVDSLQDVLLLNGPAPLFGVQIFSINTFDEALQLALSPEQRAPELVEAMVTFDEVAQVLKSGSAAQLLRNSHVVARLQKVTELAPNHESARLLLMQGLGRAPQHLSLAGSFLSLDRISDPILAEGSNATEDDIKDASIRLRRIRNTLDPRTKEASDALDDLMVAISTLHKGRIVRGSARFNEIIGNINTAIDRINNAYEDLRSDPQVQEELNY